MGIYGDKHNRIFVAMVTAMFCIFMVIFPEVTIVSAKKGIFVWASSVLPALLPFFIGANFLTNLKVIEVLPVPLYVFSMSVMSGYPMGAKILADLHKKRLVNYSEVKDIISYCSTSGPTFMIGAVGISMIGSAQIGMIIAISHYLGALVNGVFFRKINHIANTNQKKKRVSKCICKGNSDLQEKSLIDAFSEAIFSSFSSLGIILAYIVVFMLITDIFNMYLSSKMQVVPLLMPIIKGMCEMTVGCSSVTGMISVSQKMMCIICTGLISFGGFSIIGQSLSMMRDTPIKFSYFLMVKLFHCIFATLICFVLYKIIV